MSFDPNWPPTNAEVESAPFRNQFNSLRALITTDAAGPVDTIDPLDSSASAADVVDKFNELLARMKRQ